MAIVVRNGHGSLNSNPGRVFAFHSANTHMKGKNSAILLPSTGK